MTAPDGQVAPLGSVVVLDLGTIGPGARACRILADYGAEIVRLEPPPRLGRLRPPFYAYGALRGFRRCVVDLSNADGVAVALDLAAVADVVVEGFRPGVADRLGVGYDAVREHNADVVYCSATGYGQDGPYTRWAGHDINYLAVAGYLDNGERGANGPPALPGATVADSAGGGMHAAMAVMAALFGRANGGSGAFLDVAATDGVLGLMAVAVDEHLATGRLPEPGAGLLTGRYACYGVYTCGDGRFLSVGAIEPAFFANLCRALGRLADLAAAQYDDDAQSALRTELAACFAAKGRDEWVDELAGLDTCVAPVRSVAEVGEDPHLVARGDFVVGELTGRGALRQVGPVWAGAPAAATPYALPDRDASETDALLARIGYSTERTAALRASAIVE